MFDLFHWGVAVQTAAARTGWEGWPFSTVGSPWLTGVARLIFVAVVFFGIAWLLRKLFGPGGCMRPSEFGTDHIEVRRAKREQAKELRRQYKDGLLSDEDYGDALKTLWKDDDGAS